jgi:hypothetical protein
MCPHCMMAFLMGLAGIGPIVAWIRARWIAWHARYLARHEEAQRSRRNVSRPTREN